MTEAKYVIYNTRKEYFFSALNTSIIWTKIHMCPFWNSLSELTERVQEFVDNPDHFGFDLSFIPECIAVPIYFEEEHRKEDNTSIDFRYSVPLKEVLEL